MSERDFFGSEDAEFDALWAEDVQGDDPVERDDSEEYEEDDEDGGEPSEESDEYDDDEDGDEEEGDEEPEGDVEGEDDNEDGEPADPLADQRAQLEANAEAALQKVKEVFDARVAEVQANETRVKTATALMQLKERMTPDEWQQFTNRLTQAYAVQQLQAQRNNQSTELENAKKVIQTFVARDEMIESNAAQAAMREVAITKATQDYLGGKVSRAEQLALENAPPERFMAVVQSLIDARQGQTQPARDALRERRQMLNGDRAPLRSTGGANGTKRNYDNFDPDKGFDAYWDDLTEGTPLQSAPKRGKRKRAA